ncbi:MAG: response regulator transcription factor [Dehalococcoidales bacterium]|jgi:DNA-binding NarL/FixJ family response regulator|nr:response regulator transcription factor [Dehalococcoidales bacterium]
MEKIRVIIADNHPAFREGLCRLLSDEKEIEVVGQAGDGEEAVNLARELKPDVAIVDVAMPKMSGIEATKHIKESSPETAVLIVSAFNYQTYILASLRAGAAGYLTKDTPIRELITAVRLAHAGDGIIDRNAANNIIRHLISDKNGKKGNLDLYPREIEVLKLTARGMRNKEIARELNISERTVQAHLSNIFSKLEVDSRTEAVLQALKEGWLDICDLS